MQTAYKRIAELDHAINEEVDFYPKQAIKFALRVGLAIASAINELGSAVDDVARRMVK